MLEIRVKVLWNRVTNHVNPHTISANQASYRHGDQLALMCRTSGPAAVKMPFLPDLLPVLRACYPYNLSPVVTPFAIPALCALL
jgi:hypothetical protein